MTSRKVGAISSQLILFFLSIACSLLFVGLIVLVDETTNLTSWFISADDQSQIFNGVQLTKVNDSLSVSYRTGMRVILIVIIILIVVVVSGVTMGWPRWANSRGP